jgi:hypothetical protein
MRKAEQLQSQVIQSSRGLVRRNDNWTILLRHLAFIYTGGTLVYAAASERFEVPPFIRHFGSPTISVCNVES